MRTAWIDHYKNLACCARSCRLPIVNQPLHGYMLKELSHAGLEGRLVHLHLHWFCAFAFGGNDAFVLHTFISIFCELLHLVITETTDHCVSNSVRPRSCVFLRCWHSTVDFSFGDIFCQAVCWVYRYIKNASAM